MHNWTKQGTPILKMYPIYMAYADFNKKSQKSPALLTHRKCNHVSHLSGEL